MEAGFLTYFMSELLHFTLLRLQDFSHLRALIDEPRNNEDYFSPLSVTDPTPAIDCLVIFGRPQ